MNNARLKKRSLSQEDLFNLSELFKLMKPRVMSLVIFTCAVGLLTAPNIVSTKDAIIGILLVSLGAGAAGALNMWYESDLDALMSRTCLRPIPTGKVNKNQALIFGVTLSIVSVVALDYFTNIKNIPKPDYLKIDAQGAELIILKGGQDILNNTKFVQLEVSYVDYNLGGCMVEDILNHMRINRFLPVGFNHIKGDTYNIIQGDILFHKFSEFDYFK